MLLSRGTYISLPSGFMCSCVNHVYRSTTHPILPRKEIRDQGVAKAGLFIVYFEILKSCLLFFFVKIRHSYRDDDINYSYHENIVRIVKFLKHFYTDDDINFGKL